MEMRKIMRKSVMIPVLLLSTASFAQRTDTIRDTRVGGVRPGTIQRAKQAEDPAVKKEIAATSKETGVSRGKLLNEFRDAQQKFAEKTGQQGKTKTAIALTTANTTPAFTVQDFHKAKVFSVQNKVPMDAIVDRTAKLGDVDKALADLKTNPQ